MVKKSKGKKGNRSWKPSSLLPEHNKKDGFRYRYISNDRENVRKKLAEGWELVQDRNQEPIAVNDISGRETYDTGTIEDGKPISTIVSHRELFLARMPEDMAKERDKYYQDLTKEQRLGLKSKAQNEADVLAREAGAAQQDLSGKTIIE